MVDVFFFRVTLLHKVLLYYVLSILCEMFLLEFYTQHDFTM